MQNIYNLQSVPKTFWQTIPNSILENLFIFGKANFMQFLLDWDIGLVFFGTDWTCCINIVHQFTQVLLYNDPCFVALNEQYFVPCRINYQLEISVIWYKPKFTYLFIYLFCHFVLLYFFISLFIYKYLYSSFCKYMYM